MEDKLDCSVSSRYVSGTWGFQETVLSFSWPIFLVELVLSIQGKHTSGVRMAQYDNISRTTCCCITTVSTSSTPTDCYQNTFSGSLTSPSSQNLRTCRLSSYVFAALAVFPGGTGDGADRCPLSTGPQVASRRRGKSDTMFEVGRKEHAVFSPSPDNVVWWVLRPQ